jgi:hypothetical protein
MERASDAAAAACRRYSCCCLLLPGSDYLMHPFQAHYMPVSTMEDLWKEVTSPPSPPHALHPIVTNFACVSLWNRMAHAQRRKPNTSTARDSFLSRSAQVAVVKWDHSALDTWLEKAGIRHAAAAFFEPNFALFARLCTFGCSFSRLFPRHFSFDASGNEREQQRDHVLRVRWHRAPSNSLKRPKP